MKMEGLTPVVELVWSELNKLDEHGYYNATVQFDPTKNEKHKAWLGQLRDLCANQLTAQGAKPPYWKYTKDETLFRIRFSSKYEVTDYTDAEDQPIDPPKWINNGTKIQIKYKFQVSTCGRYLNVYLNAVKIVEIPPKEEAAEKAAEYENPDDVPF